MVKRIYMVASLILIVSLLISFCFGACWGQADLDNDGIPDSTESQLASKYAPYLHYAEGETFFPTVINYHITNSALHLKSNETSVLVDANPTISSISVYVTEDYFLKNTLGAMEEIFEDYEQKRESLGYTVYCRVSRVYGTLVVQYWFFYAFNPGALNQHQGDWEMITIVLNSTETPEYAVYSQHFTGEKASWDDVEKADETHPRVYAALGSHANYFRPYQGKLGFESDTVGNAFAIGPDDYQLVLLGELGAGNHPASQDWLEFGGRWGDWSRQVDVALGAAGPFGPGHGENEEKWTDPISWGADFLLVGRTWLTLSWITFHFAYIFAAILAILLIVKVWRIARRKKEGKLGLRQILHSKGSVGLIIGTIGIAIYLVALLLPWYLVSGNIQTTVLETVDETDLVLIDGINGVRVNTFQSDQGLAPLFGLDVPFSIILLSGALLNVLDIVGVEKAKNLSRTFIVSGITSLIPIIIILVFIIALGGLISSFASAISGGSTPAQIQEMTEKMSASPVMGHYSGTIDSFGNLSITWGLAIGAYLFLASMVTKITGGILLRRTQEEESRRESQSVSPDTNSQDQQKPETTLNKNPQ